MKKGWLGVIGVAVVIVFALIASSLSSKITPSTSTPVAGNTTPALQTAPSVKNPALVIGSQDAKATIIEYADFKCPVCNKFFHVTEPQIKQDYVANGKAKIVFKNLAQIAPDSKRAAEGAFCAADQRKFEAYHDTLYNYIWDNYYSKGIDGESADVFTADRLQNLATLAGLDAPSFSSCFNSHIYQAAVDQEIAEAHSQGAYGTPSFLVGGQKISGAQVYGVFKPLIEAQLQ